VRKSVTIIRLANLRTPEPINLDSYHPPFLKDFWVEKSALIERCCVTLKIKENLCNECNIEVDLMTAISGEIYWILKEERERWPILTLSLIGIIVLVFILQQAKIIITEDYGFAPEYILSRPWIFVTSVFLHSSFVHLLFNIVFLLYVGTYVEGVTKIGRRYLLITFLLAGIAGGVVCMVLGWRGIGASGAISGLLGILMLLEPTDFTTLVSRGSFFFAGIMWIIIGFLFGLTHIVHLAGLGVGLLLTFYWKKGKFSG